MSKLKELEKRLKDEPANLGLRVALAGALIEAGRRADALDLYHSVAIAYREAGRAQQAITVCRSILELAPDDAVCQALLATLVGPPPPAARHTPPELPPALEDGEVEGPPRRSSLDVTPLPAPLPYHVADPTTVPPQTLAPTTPAPVVWQEAARIPEIEGIAHAARQISASLLARQGGGDDHAEDEDDASAEEAGEGVLDTGDLASLDTGDLASLDTGDLASLDTGDLASLAVLDDALDPDHVDALEPAHDSLDTDSVDSLGPAGDDTSDADDVIDVTEAEDGFERRRARMDPHAALEHLGTLRPTVPLGRPRAQPDADDDDELTLPPMQSAIPRARGVDDEKTRPRDLPAGLRPSSSEILRRSSPGLRPSSAETEPRARLAPVARAERSKASARPPVSDPHAPRSEASDPRAALRTMPAAATDERRKPPSIAPATLATGPLASALFAPIPPRDRATLLQRFHRRIAAIGTTVIRRGETGHGLVLVVRGQLDVHAEDTDGARVSLEAIGPGDYVGEIGLVSRSAATAYVVAAMDCELLVLDAGDFYEIASAYPALWAAVSNVAERRSRDHARRLQG